MNSIDDLMEKACSLRDDLETFRRAMERSENLPGIKSTLARDIQESQARVDDVIQVVAPLLHRVTAGDLVVT